MRGHLLERLGGTPALMRTPSLLFNPQNAAARPVSRAGNGEKGLQPDDTESSKHWREPKTAGSPGKPWSSTRASACAGGPRGRAYHMGQLPGVLPRESQTLPPALWRLLGYSPQLHATFSRKKITSLTLS